MKEELQQNLKELISTLNLWVGYICVHQNKSIKSAF